jgi:hypothetical protein
MKKPKEIWVCFKRRTIVAGNGLCNWLNCKKCDAVKYIKAPKGKGKEVKDK